MGLINFFNELTATMVANNHLSQLNRFVDPTQLDIHSTSLDGYVDTSPNVRCPNENLCPQFTPEQKEFMGECTRVHIEFIDLRFGIFQSLMNLYGLVLQEIHTIISATMK